MSLKINRKNNAPILIFYVASAKDQNLVTVNLSELGIPAAKLWPKNSLFIITIKVDRQIVPILFKVNRVGKTAMCKSWPRILPAPFFKSSVVFEIQAVDQISSLTNHLP